KGVIVRDSENFALGSGLRVGSGATGYGEPLQWSRVLTAIAGPLQQTRGVRKWVLNWILGVIPHISKAQTLKS
ncbi:hypothetical protein HAX54_017818, partial [Datura stramonium]|nr:hypothetical protein [Datura stramonium]